MKSAKLGFLAAVVVFAGICSYELARFAANGSAMNACIQRPSEKVDPAAAQRFEECYRNHGGTGHVSFATSTVTEFNVSPK